MEHKMKEESNGNIAQDSVGLETKENCDNEFDEEVKKKKRKIRTCGSVHCCMFRNVWTHPDRCYASFPIWHTCINKGFEKKI